MGAYVVLEAVRLLAEDPASHAGAVAVDSLDPNPTIIVSNLPDAIPETLPSTYNVRLTARDRSIRISSRAGRACGLT